ncbi:MAG TPA: class I adenylate-forming enzyme family protein, partial [Bacteroidota bacterium]|nr:class I adenylate-forming enzyme family protein [Bacteroidota bacterium]
MGAQESSLRDKIRNARSVGGVPPERYLTPFTTILSLLRHRASETPGEPFLIYQGDGGARTVFSYKEIFRQVCKTARYLMRMGIGRGDRVATVAYNHSDTVIQYFACWCMGAVIVPVNIGEDDRRIAYILSNSDVRLAFVRAEFAERIGKLLPGIPRGMKMVIVGGAEGAFETAVEAENDGPDGLPETSPEDDALIVYTSGTTGHPKGVLLIQYNLLVDAMAIAGWHGMTPGERMLCVLPIHHVNGIVVTLVTPLWYRGSVALRRRFHTEEFWTTIAREDVRVASVVPTLLQFLLHAGPVPPETDRSRFRHIICGAGPLTCELAANFEATFGIPIVHGYGLSETTCYSCFLPLEVSREEHARWLRDYGFP